MATNALYQITLGSNELKASTQFIDYLHHRFCGSEHIGNDWHRQQDEGTQEEVWGDTNEKALEILGNDECRDWLKTALNVLLAEMQGNRRPLHDLLDGWKYLWVVGIPRSGGTYLLKEALTAAGIDYTKAHRGVYHDSYPAVNAFRSDTHAARYLKLTWHSIQMAVMSRIEAETHDIQLVPKKSHLLAMDWPFFKRFGATVFKTHRPFQGFLQSVLDKAGGMPADGLIPRQRINIERQVYDTLVFHGHDIGKVRRMPYVAAMRLYYRYYRIEMESVPGIECQFKDMFTHAQTIHDLYGSDLEPEEFLCKKQSLSLSPSILKAIGSPLVAI